MNLNNNQIKAINHKENPCMVIAGAGSGKTRVLINRIVKLIESGVNPSEILAVTFSKKASTEMKERLLSLIGDVANSVNIGTFHSICYNILRVENTNFKNSVIASDSWVEITLNKILEPYSKSNIYGLGFDDWSIGQAKSFISWQKNHLIKHTDRILLDDSFEFLRWKFEKLYTNYEIIKQKENKIDFDDMLLQCYDLLSNNETIREKYQTKYKYVLTDEFQDTNHAQFELLKILCAYHRNIFVVGDIRQAIYSWRGSDVNIMMNFKNIYPDTEIIKLDINYRCSRDIVEWSNKLIKVNNNHLCDDVKAYKEYNTTPKFIYSYNEHEEADKIAKEIIELIRCGKYDYKDMSCLYRCNAQSWTLEEVFIINKIPYETIGSCGFLDRVEVKYLVAFLELAINPHNDNALLKVINVPNRFLGKVFIDNLKQFCLKNKLSLYEGLTMCPESKSWRYSNGTNEIYNIISTLHRKSNIDTYNLLTLIRKTTKLDEFLVKDDRENSADNSRVDNLNTFVESSKNYPTLQSFLSYLDDMRNQNTNDDNDNKVKLMTLHKSKGLEFPVVFLTGVCQDVLPHKNTVDIFEERRLMYVGMTRAMDLLYISWTEQYKGKIAGNSMFINNLITDKEIKAIKRNCM